MEEEISWFLSQLYIFYDGSQLQYLSYPLQYYFALRCPRSKAAKMQRISHCQLLYKSNPTVQQEWKMYKQHSTVEEHT